MSSANPSTRPKILVAGGGLVGNTLALALAARGLAVTLVEPRTAAPDQGDPADTRHLALAEGSVLALQRLGVWPALAESAGAIRRVEVSRRGAPGQLRLDAAEHGFERFGAVVPAPLLLRALDLKVADCAQIEVLTGVGVEYSEAGNQLRRVMLSDGSTREVALLVAADGTDSPLRTGAAIPARVHDYQQSLISCSIRSRRVMPGSAFERLDQDGPLALLPRPDGRMGLVWTLSSGDAQARMADADGAFCAAFQERFGYRLVRLSSPGRRSLWPLRLIYAEQLHADRLVLVGNAAQTIHPIGAQGFNLGLRDALALAQCQAGRDDPGEPAVLAHYESLRRPDREQTLAWTSQLLAMRPGHSLLGPAAGLGLALVDLLPGLQRALVERAMGMAVLPWLPEAA